MICVIGPPAPLVMSRSVARLAQTYFEIISIVRIVSARKVRMLELEGSFR